MRTQAQSSGASVTIESLSHHREIVLLPEVLEGNIEKLKRVDFEISTFRQALCDAGSIQRSLSNHREPQSPSRASVTIDISESSIQLLTQEQNHQFTNSPIGQFTNSPNHQLTKSTITQIVFIFTSGKS